MFFEIFLLLSTIVELRFPCLWLLALGVSVTTILWSALMNFGDKIFNEAKLKSKDRLTCTLFLILIVSEIPSTDEFTVLGEQHSFRGGILFFSIISEFSSIINSFFLGFWVLFIITNMKIRNLYKEKNEQEK